MNQIKRIICSTLGRALAMSVFVVILVTASMARDLQASGVAVGQSHDSAVGSDLGRRGHGFVRTNGGFTTIDAPDATYYTVAFGINRNGNSVGVYVDGSGKKHGFVRDQSAFKLIDYPGSSATFAARINDQGQIVGAYGDEPFTAAFSLPHGFLLENGVFRTIDYPGARRTQLFGINNLGQIVGNYVDQDGTSHGLLWNNGSFTTIDAPGGTSTTVYDINDRGQIVGLPFTGYLLDAPGPAFLRDANGVFTRIDILGSPFVEPFGINNNGDIVGVYADPATGNTRAFLLSQGIITTLDDPDATVTTLVFDIDDAGQLAGAYDIVGHGYLKNTDGTLTTIDHPDAVDNTGETMGLNNRGLIVGSYSDINGIYHGFLLDKSRFFRLDPPDASLLSAPVKINERGQVVGAYLGTDQKVHGYLYDGGAFTAINVPFGDAVGTTATDINNRGQIVGTYPDNNGRFHGFLRDTSGNFTHIEVPSPNTIRLVTGINDLGHILGSYIDSAGIQHGFTLNNRGFLGPIDVPGARATIPNSINNRDQVVGQYLDGGRYYGFMWDNGKTTSLPDHPGAFLMSFPSDIDDQGRIVGIYF